MDIAQTTDVTHTASAIKRMEDRRERRKGVGAGLNDLTHHIDLDRTDIAQGQADIGTGVGHAVQTIINLIQ